MTSHAPGQAGLPDRAVRGLATATAVLVRDHDVIGTITTLLAECAECVEAAAAGVVVRYPGGNQLEFLAATDHRSQHLELYQVQIEEGPGVECVATGKAITMVDLEQVAGRWPALRDPFAAAGFTGVHAAPMVWQGTTFGALNLFTAEGELAAASQLVAQAFADLAAVVVMQTTPASPAQIAERTVAALAERTVIEQAKGVIAYRESLPIDAAFDQLLALAGARRQPLTLVAADVVDQATRSQQA